MRVDDHNVLRYAKPVPFHTVNVLFMVKKGLFSMTLIMILSVVMKLICVVMKLIWSSFK